MISLKIMLAAAVAVFVAHQAAAQQGHDGGHGRNMEKTGQHGAMPVETKSGTVSGTGVINAIDAEEHSVNLSHEPIPAIGWPAMTMDFEVADDVDLSALEKGDAVAFTLERGADGIYTITGLDLAE